MDEFAVVATAGDAVGAGAGGRAAPPGRRPCWPDVWFAKAHRAEVGVVCGRVRMTGIHARRRGELVLFKRVRHDSGPVVWER